MLERRLRAAHSSREIIAAITEAARGGELRPGAELPSVRALAAICGVSPGTAALAFRALRERGVITTTHGRRARVADRAVLPEAYPSLPPGVRDLTVTAPDPALLPDLAPLLTPDAYAGNLYHSEIVEPSLHAVMTAQFRADGIDGVLTTTNGAVDALERLLSVTVRPGEAVIIEDPVWAPLRELLRVLHLDVVPVPVDGQGLQPDALAQALATRPCAAVVLTPRAQNPYGSALSAARAQELRAVAAAHPTVMVIEDDHAGLIAGVPAETVTRGRARWAVIRSVSKALGPDLRVAVTASDPDTADLLQSRLALGPGWVSHLSQRLVARALTDESVLAQVAAAERTYAARRQALMDALAAAGIAAIGRSGLTVLVPVSQEASTVAHLMSDGWGVRAGEPFRIATPPFVRIVTTTLLPQDVPHLVDSLARVRTGTGRTPLR